MKQRGIRAKVKRTQGEGSIVDTVIYIASLLIWVWGMMIGVQWIVANIVWVLFHSTIPTRPYFTAISSVLSGILALVAIVLVPKWILLLKSDSAKSKSSHSSLKSFFARLRAELGLKNLLTWTDVGLAPIGYIAYLLFAGLLNSLFSIFPWFNANEPQDVGLDFFMSKPEMVVSFYTIVIITPLVEELIFRGFLYGKLREKLAEKSSNKISIIVSIVLVSLLFGVMHGQWNVGLNVFVLSTILCIFREITGTIYAGILLHMLTNGIAFYCVYVLGAGIL